MDIFEALNQLNESPRARRFENPRERIHETNKGFEQEIKQKVADELSDAAGVSPYKLLECIIVDINDNDTFDVWVETSLGGYASSYNISGKMKDLGFTHDDYDFIEWMEEDPDDIDNLDEKIYSRYEFEGSAEDFLNR